MRTVCLNVVIVLIVLLSQVPVWCKQMLWSSIYHLCAIRHKYVLSRLFIYLGAHTFLVCWDVLWCTKQFCHITFLMSPLTAMGHSRIKPRSATWRVLAFVTVLMPWLLLLSKTMTFLAYGSSFSLIPSWCHQHCICMTVACWVKSITAEFPVPLSRCWQGMLIIKYIDNYEENGLVTREEIMTSWMVCSLYATVID